MAFFYLHGRLKVGAENAAPEALADVAELAREAGGPIYIYDLDDIRARYEALSGALAQGPGITPRHTLHYAMKANSHPEILKLLGSLGAGVDTVSAGEIRIAIAAGIPPGRIIFSGVAKTEKEIEYALEQGIKQINVESPQELERIARVAKRLGTMADVAFRMNPDVNPQTHPYITTGFRENKFGMDESFLPELIAILKREKSHLRPRGLTLHIGSQIFEIDVLAEAIEKTLAIHRHFENEGFRFDRLDIGGGLGVHYEQPTASSEAKLIENYGLMVRQLAKGLDVEILTEPGRILVARAGLLVGEVQYVKQAPAKTFAILDTGMHHLIRPALYGAKHRVLPVALVSAPAKTYDVVGPICESSDFLAKDISLPEVRQGDLLAIADAGAYGFVMASHYNAHALPAEICVSRGRRIS
jgi:diaminopimelate decarboxylase